MWVEQVDPPTHDSGEAEAEPVTTEVELFVPGRGEGRPVLYDGVLRPVGMSVWRRPSRHRLVRYDYRGRAVTHCYVVGDAARLAEKEGQAVILSGKEFRVQGVKYPVVVVEQVLPGDESHVRAPRGVEKKSER